MWWSANLDNSGQSTAVYDGLGQRVQTTVNGNTRTLVYDAFGQMVAEYNSQVVSLSGGVKYLLTDLQGSTRVITDSNGNVIARHDYQAFGSEIGAGVGLRTTSQQYGAVDSTRQKYAVTERDEATGLDQTDWRKYDSLSGRWTSPDPYKGSMSVGVPQSFNRYSYVGNDPVNFSDPSGLDDAPPDCGPGTVPQKDATGQWQCVGTGVSTVTVTGRSWDDMTGYLPDWADDDLAQQMVWVLMPQQSAPLGDLAANVAKKLTGDCGDFVKDLYKTVAGMFPGQERHSKDFNLLDVFNTINKRAGGVVLKPGLMVGGKPAGGTVSGAIGNPDQPATILLAPAPGGTPVATSWAQQEDYAIEAIHETFHLAGTHGGYNDDEMAAAVFKLTGTPGYPKPGSSGEDYSKYWNAVLWDRCRLRK